MRFYSKIGKKNKHSSVSGANIEILCIEIGTRNNGKDTTRNSVLDMFISFSQRCVVSAISLSGLPALE